MAPCDSGGFHLSLKYSLGPRWCWRGKQQDYEQCCRRVAAAVYSHFQHICQGIEVHQSDPRRSGSDAEYSALEVTFFPVGKTSNDRGILLFSKLLRQRFPNPQRIVDLVSRALNKMQEVKNTRGGTKYDEDTKKEHTVHGAVLDGGDEYSGIAEEEFDVQSPTEKRKRAMPTRPAFVVRKINPRTVPTVDSHFIPPYRPHHILYAPKKTGTPRSVYDTTPGSRHPPTSATMLSTPRMRPQTAGRSESNGYRCGRCDILQRRVNLLDRKLGKAKRTLAEAVHKEEVRKRAYADADAIFAPFTVPTPYGDNCAERTQRSQLSFRWNDPSYHIAAVYSNKWAYEDVHAALRDSTPSHPKSAREASMLGSARAPSAPSRCKSAPRSRSSRPAPQQLHSPALKPPSPRTFRPLSSHLLHSKPARTYSDDFEEPAPPETAPAQEVRSQQSDAQRRTKQKQGMSREYSDQFEEPGIRRHADSLELDDARQIFPPMDDDTEPCVGRNADAPEQDDARQFFPPMDDDAEPFVGRRADASEQDEAHQMRFLMDEDASLSEYSDIFEAFDDARRPSGDTEDERPGRPCAPVPPNGDSEKEDAFWRDDALVPQSNVPECGDNVGTDGNKDDGISRGSGGIEMRNVSKNRRPTESSISEDLVSNTEASRTDSKIGPSLIDAVGSEKASKRETSNVGTSSSEILVEGDIAWEEDVIESDSA
eukprot:GEMP01008086.1.p1 GENE.GEMP01008086.1~~GEMP01008086.1.p1  ORF type:complete len:707 (+),score=208.10 GEMP01008086.1:205-2325(+)